LISVTLLYALCCQGQTVTGPQGYKVIDIGNNGQVDYTRSLILLHEISSGPTIEFNNAVGTITAFRGSSTAYHRNNIAYVNTSSAYNGTYGTVQSVSEDQPWKLKTCVFNGKKYIALDVPYQDAYQNCGFQFAGWANSSGESLKCVNYMVAGNAVNQSLLSNIQDFISNW
jgi:hypothetical protein